ncbi:MAG TPA: SDR family NAD(P)-dependent oxidoreductase [Candidatus Acidoferrales bacterium]|nr:SDR family NAD(P)-dependent oxidoreductase [Candidatus Acidoferrales bacterium]
MSLAGKHAFVTGAASGIGRSIALRLAHDGADVALFDLNGDALQSVAREITGRGRRVCSAAGDVSDASSVRAAAEQMRRTLGTLDILVNSAGICTFVPFLQMDDATFDRMLSVHVRGTFLCCRELAPEMIAAGSGRIVNIASVAGLNGGGAGLAHYAAAKGGIIGLTKALAQELGPSGVTVNAIAPGLIDTPMVRASGMADDFIRQIGQRVPVRRVGQPDDIAAACAYLVSPEAGFITGQVISPNGGGYL